MGSQPSKSTTQQNNQERVPPLSESHVPTDPPPVSRESFDIFLTCIKTLPFSLTNEQFETLIYDISEKTYAPNSFISHAGAEPAGILVVLEGTCNVLASDQRTILRCLRKGEFLGELSSLYNVPFTCSVQSGSNETHMLCLPIDRIKSFDLQLMPMKEWYLKQKYLDTNSMFPSMEITSLLIENSMLACPFFYGWSRMALQCIYKSLLPSAIEIYSPSNVIFFPYDQMACAYLLLHGEMEIFSDNRSIVVNAKNDVIWFGDEQLFCSNRKSLTARALSLCQLITFPVELFENINEDYEEYAELVQIGNLWERHLQTRDVELYERYFDFMNLFSLMYQLKQSNIFNYTDSTFLYYISFGFVTQLFKVNETIMVHVNEREKLSNNGEGEESPLLMLMLTGSCIVMKMDVDSDENLHPGDMFYFNSTYEDKCHVKTLEDSLIAIISKQHIDNLKSKFPEALINIDW